MLREAYPNSLTPTAVQQLLSDIKLPNVTQTLRRMHHDQQITKDTHGQYKANTIQPPRLHLSAPIPIESEPSPSTESEAPPSFQEDAISQSLASENEDLSFQEIQSEALLQSASREELIAISASVNAHTKPPIARNPKRKPHRSQTKARSRPNSKSRRK